MHEYRVFPRAKGLAVSAMLSENGKELDPKKLAKEKANANKEWQKHRKDREKEPEGAGKERSLVRRPRFRGVAGGASRR